MIKKKRPAKNRRTTSFFAALNAVDYGVPQKRERLIITGFRRDLGVDWSFPKPTHSLDGLLYAQWVSGEYGEKHRICRENRPPLEAKYKARVEKLRNACPDFMKKP